MLSSYSLVAFQGFRVLHIHVFFAAPLGSSFMTQPGTDQHQGRVAIRESSNNLCPGLDFPAQPLNGIVGPDLDPILPWEVTVG